MILASGVTVEFTCTGPGLPTWYVNGIFAEGTQLDFSEAGPELTAATLTISGNHTCDTVHIYCVVVVRESQLLYKHNISITFQGLLQTSFRICGVNIDMNHAATSSVFHKLMLQFCPSQLIFLHLKIFRSMIQLTPQAS